VEGSKDRSKSIEAYKGKGRDVPSTRKQKKKKGKSKSGRKGIGTVALFTGGGITKKYKIREGEILKGSVDKGHPNKCQLSQEGTSGSTLNNRDKVPH